jgi:hypothetical protein
VDGTVNKGGSPERQMEEPQQRLRSAGGLSFRFQLDDCAGRCRLLAIGCWESQTSRIRKSWSTSNDPRMQQVVLANGKLWAGLDTGLIIEGTLPQEQASPISSSIPTLARYNSRVALESWAT